MQTTNSVIPAKAGIHLSVMPKFLAAQSSRLDPRLRGDDGR